MAFFFIELVCKTFFMTGNFQLIELKTHSTKVSHKDIVKFFSDIVAEKDHQALRQGIEGFDAAVLKKTQTQEKNPLPTKEGQ